MCGRYAASAHPDELIEEFEVVQDHTREPVPSILAKPQVPPAGAPDYNVAPTKAAPVVLTRSPREQDDAAAVRQLRLLTWGLVPNWAKDVKVGLRMINARAESALESSAFKRAALSRRCLVPADGWYEWQTSPSAVDAKGKPRKQPFFVHRSDGQRLAMAGFYEFWRDPEVTDRDDPAAWLVTYAVVTTAAEAGLDRLHDRQPLVLERDSWPEWLDPDQSDPDVVRRHLQFASPGRFDAYPVTTSVNSNRNNGPQLLDPASADDLEGVVDPLTGEVLP